MTRPYRPSVRTLLDRAQRVRIAGRTRTVQQIADEAQCSREYLYHLAKGGGATPSVAMAPRIAAALGVTELELLEACECSRRQRPRARS